MKWLKGEQVQRTRALWEEIFGEDGPEFINYYYSQKANQNNTIIIEDENKNEICSMLHLTEYQARIHFARNVANPFLDTNVEYVIAVATREDYRHRGYMKRMLLEAFSEMKIKKQVFCFLMPVNPAIYEPFDFHYIYDRPVWSLREDVLKDVQIRRFLSENGRFLKTKFGVLIQGTESLELTMAVDDEMDELAAFANGLLEKQCGAFLKRSADYYRILKKELHSQNGDLFLIKQGNKIVGTFCYAKEGELCGETFKPFIQEVICKDSTVEQTFFQKGTEGKPVIMARIIDVESLLTRLSIVPAVEPLVETKEIAETKQEVKTEEFVLQIDDSYISENRGIYRIQMTPDGSHVSRLHKSSEYVADISIEVDKLASFIFGYEPAEKCFCVRNRTKKETDTIYENLSRIHVWAPVFINELV